MKKTYIALMAFSVLALTAVCSAANWQTVTTITGAEGQTTNYFNVPTTEWRIIWSITPTDPNSQHSSFSAFIYAKGESAYVDSINGDPTQLSGTMYIHEGAKDYYTEIFAANLQSYNLKIEYDSSAPIPEFPSVALLAIVMLASVAIIGALKLKKHRVDSNCLSE